ncbi:TniQ family protein [Micromonospora sp. NPDC000089]|uniref:TniQ family protein n=1 Tax=unclassified Micromonospora TaxID=2617518 RepID=UPI0036A5334E
MTSAPTRRLPIATPPVTWETVTSYLRRLAATNHVPVRDIEAAIDASPNKISYRQTRTLNLDKLSALTGQTTEHLRRVLPELRQPAPRWWLFQAFPRPACPPCVRRHRGGTVHRYYPHHVTTCVKHNLWLGTLAPAATTWPVTEHSINIERLPEIKTAQIRHRRLVRRYGQTPVLIATTAATDTWEYLHGRYVGDNQSQRLSILRPAAHQYHADDPALHAASYPEIIAATNLFVTHRWQTQATSPRTQGDAVAAFCNLIDASMRYDPWPQGHHSHLAVLIENHIRSDSTNQNKITSAGIRYTGPRAAWTAQSK